MSDTQTMKKPDLEGKPSMTDSQVVSLRDAPGATQQGGSFQPKISGAQRKSDPSEKKRSPLVLVLAIGLPLILIVGLLIFRFVMR